ncbi:hypothetical protein MOE95_21185, partial [Bacillus spizizenii]|nr:hypothetical protein [Bacillus spizizenii]
MLFFGHTLTGGAMMTSEKDTEQDQQLNEKQGPPVPMAGRVAA